MKLSTFRQINADTGYIRPSQSDPDTLRVFGSSNVGRLFRNPGKEANRQLREEFQKAVIQEYGAEIGQDILNQAGFKIGDKNPLSVASVKSILQAGDQRAIVAQEELKSLVQMEQTRAKAAALPLEQMAVDAAKTTGLDVAINELNASDGAQVSIRSDQLISPQLRKDIQTKVEALSDGGKILPKDEDVKRVAKEALEESLKKKMAVVNALNAREGVTPETRVFALEAALKNDYTSPAAFERSYFRGEAPDEVKVSLVQNVSTDSLKLDNASVGNVLTSLKAQTYNPATYDPAGYFDEAVTGPDVGKTDYLLNAAVMGHTLSQIPGDQIETRQTLASRLAGYQMKFASVNSAETLGAQVNPLQLGDNDNYTRSAPTNLSGMQQFPLANSLGVNPANLHPVTDSRFMEVLKRSYSMEEEAKVLTWNEQDFDRLYDQIERGNKVFLDVTPFMAGTVHGHESEEVGEAIQVTNEFMHDILKAGVDDHLAKNVAYQHMDGTSQEKARAELISKMQDHLTLGAMVNVGNQAALYTAPLGTRRGEPGKEVFSEGVTANPGTYRSQIAHNGFTLGSQHLLDQWARSSETPEQMLAKLDEITRRGVTGGIAGVSLPEDTSRLARFDSPNDFYQTRIFQDFKKLGESAGAPPYVKITASATAAMLEGMKDMKLNEAFNTSELEPVLQMTYNRMQGAMQKAVAAAGDPAQFNDYLRQIELVNEQLNNTLAIAKPYDQAQFNSVMRDATDLLPANFTAGEPQFALKNSGLRGLSSALSGVEAQQGGRALNIAMQKDCYYESSAAMEESSNHSHVSLDGDQMDSSLSMAKANLGGQKLDMYVAEFHHNIAYSRDEYHAEDVTAQVDRLFDEGLVSDHFTVALDTTIATTDAQEVKDFLEHNAERIASGQLNVVMYRSGQKFDLMGMDNYNGGVMVSVNNGKDFEAYNKGTVEGRGLDNLGSLNVQGFTLLQKHAQVQLNEYRSAVMQATTKLANPQSAANPIGMPEHMILKADNRGAAMIQIAANVDDKAVFLDLRNPWLDPESTQAKDFNSGVANLLTQLSQDDPKNYHIDGRASFGFVHTNVTVIDGAKFRLNPGLEDDATLARYRDTLDSLNNILTQSKADYPCPDDFNIINGNITSSTRMESTMVLLKQQMQLKAGIALSPDQKIEAAQALHQVGNQRGAARSLDALSNDPALNAVQAQKVRDLQTTLQPLLASRPSVDVNPRADIASFKKAVGELRSNLLNEANLKPEKFLAALGQAQEASYSFGKVGAEQRLTTMLASEFKNMPASQLEAIRDASAKMAKMLPDNDPQKNFLKNVSKFADQDLAILESKGVKSPSAAEITEAYVLMADARQRAPGSDDPTPQTSIGDLYASYNYYDENPGDLKGPGTLDGDIIISREANTPQSTFIHAVIGPVELDRAGIKAAFEDPRVADTLKKIVEALPPEQRTIHVSNAIGEMDKKMDRSLRTAYASYDGMIKNATKGKSFEFSKTAAEFERSLSQMRNESQFMANILTKPEVLAQMPVEHRAALQALANQAQSIHHELSRPGGFGQTSIEFATLATKQPDTVIRQMCDTQLPQSLRQPGVSLPSSPIPSPPPLPGSLPVPSYPAPPPPAPDPGSLPVPSYPAPPPPAEELNSPEQKSVQPILQRRDSVRDVMNSNGIVRSNFFKVQDELAKTEKKKLDHSDDKKEKNSKSVGQETKISLPDRTSKPSQPNVGFGSS